MIDLTSSLKDSEKIKEFRFMILSLPISVVVILVCALAWVVRDHIILTEAIDPSLVATASFPKYVSVGEPYNIQITIINQSNMTAPLTITSQPMTVTVIYNGNLPVGASTNKQTSIAIPVLQPGERATRELTAVVWEPENGMTSFANHVMPFDIWITTEKGGSQLLPGLHYKAIAFKIFYLNRFYEYMTTVLIGAVSYLLLDWFKVFLLTLFPTKSPSEEIHQKLS